MGDLIRQRPTRQRAGTVQLIAVITAIAFGVGAQVTGNGPPLSIPVSIAGGLVAAALTSGWLAARYPSFTLAPGEVSAIYRRGQEYLLHFTTGQRRRVLLTRSPGAREALEQLRESLAHAMPLGTTASTLAGPPATSARGWEPIDRTTALVELGQIIGGGRPVPAEVEGHREERGPAPDLTPTPELLHQWQEDDERAAEELNIRGAKRRPFTLLGFLMWAFIMGGIVYLSTGEGRDPDAEMGVALSFWAGAALTGLIRGLALDVRSARVRGIATALMQESTGLRERGMPEPWVSAAMWAPAGVIGAVRGIAIGAGVIFGIGFATVVGEENWRSVYIIGGILLVLAVIWLLATRAIVV